MGHGVRDRRRATGHQALADSVKRIQAAAASTYADSLVKAGQYQQAAQEVYVAYADANPTSEKAADALRDAIETYMLADSVARGRGTTRRASKDARTHAAELSNRLITQYPLYRYRLQYQTLYADLLAETGKGDESIDALRKLIADNPDVARSRGRRDPPGGCDSTRCDGRRRRRHAYEQFAADYPHDKRASDALYNAAVTYLEAARHGDGGAGRWVTLRGGIRLDTRATQARAFRVTLLKAAGDSARRQRRPRVVVHRQPAGRPQGRLRGPCGSGRVYGRRAAVRALPADQARHRLATSQLTAAGRQAGIGHQAAVADGLTKDVHPRDRGR